MRQGHGRNTSRPTAGTAFEYASLRSTGDLDLRRRDAMVRDGWEHFHTAAVGSAGAELDYHFRRRRVPSTPRGRRA